MGKQKTKEFVFRKHDKIGSEDAEDDKSWLADCFYDVGHLDLLRQTDSKERVVLGRTGSGKTALIDKIEQEEEHAYKVDLESLSLNLIQGSNIIQYLHGIGVNLDLFYRLLWRHVFASELIALRFQDDPEFKSKGYLSRKWESIAGAFKKNSEVHSRKQALAYLEKWGNNFFSETHERIKEVVNRFEADITAGAKAKGIPVSADVSSRIGRSEQERREFVRVAQSLVNKIQIAELSKVIDILNEDIMPEGGRKFFLLIDKIDEKWVDDTLRYDLIRAMIETVRDFSKIRSAKIIVALRKDLFQRTVRLTRGSGFQEEKLTPFLLNLDWSRAELMSLADKRINHLVRRRYTKQPLSYKDLFPRQIGRSKIEDYVVARTHYRPRDLIVFFNMIISQASDTQKITTDHIKRAETEYSRDRYRSLGTEWFDDYPKLLDFSDILKGQNSSLEIGAVDLDKFEELCTRICIHDQDGTGVLAKMARSIIENQSSQIVYEDFLYEVVHVYYTTGMVGLKLSPTSPVIWSFRDRGAVSKAELNKEVKMHICPMFYRVLGIVGTE